uniref:Ionotropic glutamate receptor C-terminal domain-containing protein n=1 Tax=Stomoxys calcitrans TaxID=35570 RepID=A0A2Y9D4S2_STOCA
MTWLQVIYISLTRTFDKCPSNGQLSNFKYTGIINHLHEGTINDFNFLTWSLVVMKDLHKLVVFLVITTTITSALGIHIDLCGNKKWKNPQKLFELLKHIYKERSFESILLLRSISSERENWNTKAIYEWQVPKIIMTRRQEFELGKLFNKNVMAVIFMSENFDAVLLDACAQFLNNTRQTRIVVATNISSIPFEKQLLDTFQSYKMTRVVLAYLKDNGGLLSSYVKLQPYPNYHWSCPAENGYFYPEYWRNMHKKSVIVYAEQSIPGVFLFKDTKGNIQYSGHLGKLMKLFMKHYNATMQPYQTPSTDKSTFYTDIRELLEQDLVEIPMTTDNGEDGKWHLNSDSLEVTQVKLMVPCPTTLTIREVFHLLLNLEFIGVLIFCTILFSFIHTLIDCIFGKVVQYWSFFLDDKALPSVLGQSFTARLSPLVSLKWLYLLMFFTGLNISLHFGARLRTLLTAPPYHRHTEDFDELNRSPVTILVPQNIYREPPYAVEKLIITKDNAFYQKMRQSFNTSFGYFTTTTTWQLLKQQQQGLSHKILCIYNNLTIISPLPFALRLQRNSEFKEPLNELIHRVHELGLMQAWHLQTFTDLLKMDEVHLHHGNDNAEASVLNLGDLSWLWILWVLGLTISTVVFFGEILMGRYCT